MFDSTSNAGNGDVLSVIDAVRASLQTAALLDLSTESGQGLCDASICLEELRRLLDATQCHLLGELEARGETDRSFGLGTASWLSRQARLPLGVAKAKVSTAKKLSALLPDVDRALSQGRITFEHAKVIADAANPRISDEMSAVSAQLCKQAEDMLFNPWRLRVQSLAELLDQDGGYNPDADLARNRLRLSVTGDSLVLRGELVGEQAEIASEILNSIADELFQKYARDNELAPELNIPSRATLLAMALVEACRRGIATPVGSSRQPRPEATFVLTPADGSGADPASGIWRGFFNAVDGVPVRDFAGMAVAGSNGVLSSDRTWRTLLCDPDMHALVVDSLGVPLDLGRQIRFASRQQRRALAARDGGCVFPGCTSPPTWTDAHHVLHWEHGGTSDLSNLVSLCRHHHGVAHRRGWQLSLDSDGWSTWTSPNGHSFPGQRHQMQRHQEEALMCRSEKDDQSGRGSPSG